MSEEVKQVPLKAPAPAVAPTISSSTTTTTTSGIAPAAGGTAPAGAGGTNPQPARKRKRNKQDKNTAAGVSRKKKSESDGQEHRGAPSTNKNKNPLMDPNYTNQNSIVHDFAEESDEDDDSVDQDTKQLKNYKGQWIRLDRTSLLQAAKRFTPVAATVPAVDTAVKSQGPTTPSDSLRKAKQPRGGPNKATPLSTSKNNDNSSLGLFDEEMADLDRDGGSIFGQTTGSSNATWVECDKCKKWRRLRGVVDEKKLPSKWYCSMNKTDPERARCSAPEEEYESVLTPESAADARIRKHLRVWHRRLKCNEEWEARQPTLTRGKKKAVVTNAKDPYEWVRCCNPSCGKWRAILRIMDANTVMDQTNESGEWYCVMNTWDEKMASCAAPQENLPAIGCPSWVMLDED